MLIIYILVVILLVAMIANKYKPKTQFHNNPYKYHDLHKYVLGDLSIDSLGSISKPILWLHVPMEYNCRQWESFGSRSSFSVNQPYLYLTTQNIINKCNNSFHIIIIDDRTFPKLLPTWEYTNSTVTHIIRYYGFLELIHMYGGMITPISMICFTDLIGLYTAGTANNKMFVGETANYHTYTNHKFIPDMSFMGAQKENPEVSNMLVYMRKNITSKFTYTEESIVKMTNLLLDLHSKSTIVIISGASLGTMDASRSPISIDALMSATEIRLPSIRLYGIWLPYCQISKRSKYQWFTRMSHEQISQSDINICRYLTQSYKTSEKDYMPCMLRARGSGSPIIPKVTSQFVTNWDTPLSKGLYGLKPIYLGYDVLPSM
jgi:hypothetical protein